MIEFNNLNTLNNFCNDNVVNEVVNYIVDARMKTQLFINYVNRNPITFDDTVSEFVFGVTTNDLIDFANNRGNAYNITNIIKSRIRTHITCNYDEMIVFINEFNNSVYNNIGVGFPNSRDIIKEFYKILEKIFFYTSENNIIRNYKYSITECLANSGEMCPYCNIHYLEKKIYINNNSNRAFHFDHFFPKSKYPFLGLNYNNLIPTCSVCNSTYKKQADPSDNNVILPYPYSTDIPTLSDSYNFVFTNIRNNFFEIDVVNIQYDDRINNANDKFKITERIDSLFDSWEGHYEFCLNYLEGYYDEEAYYFYNEIITEDIRSTPLSKFKQDTLLQIHDFLTITP